MISNGKYQVYLSTVNQSTTILLIVSYYWVVTHCITLPRHSIDSLYLTTEYWLIVSYYLVLTHCITLPSIDSLYLMTEYWLVSYYLVVTHCIILLSTDSLYPVCPDEAPTGPRKSLNLLADLTGRHEAERDAIIGLIRSDDHPLIANDQARLLPYIWLRLEIRRAKKSDWFDMGGLHVGLHERLPAARSSRYSHISMVVPL